MVNDIGGCIKFFFEALLRSVWGIIVTSGFVGSLLLYVILLLRADREKGLTGADVITAEWQKFLALGKWPLIVSGTVLGLTFVWQAYQMNKALKTEAQPAIQQQSSGSYSPNIVGNNNTVVPRPEARRLTENARKIIASLAEYKQHLEGYVVEFRVSPNDTEAILFKQALHDALAEAGWPSTCVMPLTGPYPEGLILAIHQEDAAQKSVDLPSVHPASILYRCFEKAGLKPKAEAAVFIPEKTVWVYVGSNPIH